MDTAKPNLGEIIGATIITPDIEETIKPYIEIFEYHVISNSIISDQLADLWNTKAHLKFDPRHKDIDLNYNSDAAKKIFDLINNCMNETYKLITETKDEVDFDKFSNFVPKIK